MGTVFILIATFVLKVWINYRLIKTGNIDLISVNESRDRFTRGTGAVGDGAAPLWEKGVPLLGDESAPIQLIEFADFGCPFSKDESSVLRELLIKYPSIFRLQFRNFPITELHPGADLAAAAGVCANEQGKFWPMHDKLFANQGLFIDTDLIKFAGSVGLDENRFKKCLTSAETTKKVTSDIGAGKTGGVTGTPTFFISFGKGAPIKIEGALPSEVWEKIRLFFVKK